jgi:hypothetical protein
MVLNKHHWKIVGVKSQKKFQKSFKFLCTPSAAGLTGKASIQSCDSQLCLNHCVICWIFLCPSFCDNLPPPKQMVPKNKVKASVFNWNNKAKIWDLLKRQPVFSRSWVALWEKWPSTLSTACVHLSMGWFSSMTVCLDHVPTHTKGLLYHRVQQTHLLDKHQRKGKSAF